MLNNFTRLLVFLLISLILNNDIKIRDEILSNNLDNFQITEANSIWNIKVLEAAFFPNFKLS